MDVLDEFISQYLSEEEATAVAQAAFSGLPVIIDGVQGPTGKSTLCKGLREFGLTAVEKYELENDSNAKALFDKFKDNHNGAYVMIVLNKRIDKPA